MFLFWSYKVGMATRRTVTFILRFVRAKKKAGHRPWNAGLFFV
jgi:hypothetical protein